LNIRLDTLEAMILDGLRSPLMAPDLFKAFCEKFRHQGNRLRIDGNASAEVKRIDLDRIERRIRRILNAPVRALKQGAGRPRGTSVGRCNTNLPQPTRRRR
jgi:hypothetical protein